MVCEYCKREFDAKSSRARFCSTKCKTYAGREKKRSVSVPVSVEQPVALEPVSVGLPEDSIDARLQMFLDEYEKVYFQKRPRFMPKDIWQKMKAKRLEELKYTINGYKQQRNAGKEV